MVDDDAPIRRMLDRTLAAEGYEVRSAADGGAALAALEASAPDAVVLDVSMPGLDGLEVCRRLRAKRRTIPILLLTARDAVDDRVAGLDAGADDYLVKPFAPEELTARLRALLRRGRECRKCWRLRTSRWTCSRVPPSAAARELHLSAREADIWSCCSETRGTWSRARWRSTVSGAALRLRGSTLSTGMSPICGASSVSLR